MRPVNQSKLYAKDGIHNGNCFAACLASLLELPLWMVPPFEDMFGRGDWRPRVDEWLKRLFNLNLVRWDMGDEPEDFPEYYIANGKSNRGVHHSVIYSHGAMVHDPHFSNDGITEVEWVWYLQALDNKPLDDEPSEKVRKFEPNPEKPIVHGAGESPKATSETIQVQPDALRKPNA